jgi:hypothetical protein
MADTFTEKRIDAWYRDLNDGRVEVMCRAPGFRIRVSAPAEQAWRAVELFEDWTGLAVVSEHRPRRRPHVDARQLSMMDLPDGVYVNG